eukprot:scaffold109_cov252-Pinguiococcus_pyrenoidosus.AAC.69
MPGRVSSSSIRASLLRLLLVGVRKGPDQASTTRHLPGGLTPLAFANQAHRTERCRSRLPSCDSHVRQKDQVTEASAANRPPASALGLVSPTPRRELLGARGSCLCARASFASVASDADLPR